MQNTNHLMVNILHQILTVISIHTNISLQSYHHGYHLAPASLRDVIYYFIFIDFARVDLL